MSPQNDFIIANSSGASVRQDLNNALQALVSNSSGATAPATTYAYQFWSDTTAGQLKQRNSTNDAWIVVAELDGIEENLVLRNKTAEDFDNGRESIVSFQGTQSNNAVSTLSSVEGNHSGALNDTKGRLVLKTNNGSTLTTAATIDDQQTVTLTGDLTIPDKIVHSNDANTAIRFLAADTVTVETNGIERLRVSNAGVILSNGDLTTADKIIHNGDTDTFIRFPSANAFSVTTGNVEALTVDSQQHATFSTSVSGTMRYETSVTVTSGSLVEFNNLPSWAKRITVVGYSISFSGNASVLGLRVKSGGSAVTSSYRCTSSTSFGDGTTTTVGEVKYVTAVGFNFGTASSERQLEIVFTSVTGNRWIYAGMHGGIFNSGLGFGNTTAAGDVDAGGALDGIQIFPTTPSDTFTGGTMTVICEG